MMLGQEQDPGGESQPPLAPVLFSRSTTTQQEVKVENQEDLGEIWETRWQEFLTTVEVPQTLPEPSPWEDAHIFLDSFEQVARAFQWPKEEWVARLRPTLGGDAEQAYSSLEAGDREDYGKMKAAILHADAWEEELGPRPENTQPLERGPSDAGQKLQFSRELKMEEDADADQIARNICSECGKQFDSVLDLNVHKKIHQEQNPNGRTGSGETSGKKQTLEQKKHPEPLAVRKTYKCPECEKSFIWVSSYHRHKKIHLRNKSIPLPYQKKSFKQGSHLMKFQPSPIGNKHYKCPECEKSFPALKSLEKHKKLHQTHSHQRKTVPVHQL
ncbi:Zinc finger protein, partial [Ophiophagus hannah]